MINKKGAMFGLDARIALAIFGALSVISGAALYSAIQEAKVVGIITQLNEVSKAWEQYYIDTGESLPISSSHNMDARALIENPGVSGWKGPYLPYSISGLGVVGVSYGTGTLYIVEGKVSEWTTVLTCLDRDDCGAYVHFAGIRERSIIDAIDQRLDGGDGDDKGRFRVVETNDTDLANKRIYYYITHLNSPKSI